MKLMVLLVLVLGAVVGLVALTARRNSGASILYLAGLAMLFVAERLAAGGDLQTPLDAAAVLVLVISFGLRARALAGAEGRRRETHQQALLWSGLGAISLLGYGLTTDTATRAMGLDEDGAASVYVVMNSLWPILCLIGALPTLLLDRVLSTHPVQVPRGATRSTVLSGLGAALAIALVFPVNYLADQHEVEWDYSYFRVTRPGESTVALVQSLSEPITVSLFFSPASDVKAELLPYFEQLERASGGNLILEELDQPTVPKRAEELSIRDNGYVAVTRGDVHESFKVGTDIDKARRELKKLDATFQKTLLKMAKGKRTAYLLTGHGEANARESDNPLYKLSLLKKLLTSQNYKVDDLGIESGSADHVPDDAALVIIAAPEKDLLPEEEAALEKYLDGGGALMVLADPGRSRMEGLLAHIGVAVGEYPLANATQHIRQNRGIADRVLLFSNRFGTHPSVSTLSKYSSQLSVILPTVAPLTKIEGTTAKQTTLIRSMASTWAETDGDFVQSDAETGAVHDLALAVTGPDGEKPYRVIVVGDVSLFSDPVLQFSQGSAQFAYDAARWLVGDEDLVGDVASEEDVKIQHTREEDQLWFWGAVVFVPVMVLVFGGILIALRGRRS